MPTCRFHVAIPIQQSVGPSLTDRPFEPNDTTAQGSDPGSFVLVPFNSTIPHSESWHRFGRNFALAYIRTYLWGLQSDVCVHCSPALSSAGATISQTYLPFGRYQASLGHRRLFPTVSPANTLVRWGGTQCLRLHSAGSTIPHLWPTGSSLFDYDPVVLLKPFRPRLTTSALPFGV